MLVAGLIGVGPPAVQQSQAVIGGVPATTDMAQVRIFENGEFVGGGTVVDRNWVLTVGNIFERIDATAYTLRFGVVTHDCDNDNSSLRTIDDPSSLPLPHLALRPGSAA
jgi:hypothetical protein